MRLVLTVVAGLALAGCAGARASAPPYGATFTELSREVDSMPSSPQKKRIEKLLDELETQIISSARTDLSDALIDDLTRLGEYMAPARLELGFATDGRNWSGGSSDDGVEVHLTPKDSEGSAIKTPGTVYVSLGAESALGFGLGGRQLDHWTLPPDQLSALWNASLFPSYVVRLPWTNGRPAVSSGVLTVTFRPLYGQPLTAKKPVTIHAGPPA